MSTDQLDDSGAVFSNPKPPQPPASNKSPSDGEIFLAIRQCQKNFDTLNEEIWWDRLSKSKRKYTRLLLRHAPLTRGFDNLSAIPGLWDSMGVGSLHKLRYLHCDEVGRAVTGSSAVWLTKSKEIVRYLSSIKDAWVAIVGGSDDMLRSVDSQTVQALESTSPAFCLNDRRRLGKQMLAGTLFPKIKDPDIRQGIWTRLCDVGSLIPSFRTFFNDMRYLTMVHDVIKTGLLIGVFPTTRGSLFQSFINNPACTRECAQLRKAYLGCECRTCPHIPDAYTQLWLFAMRNRRLLDSATFHQDQLVEADLDIDQTSCVQDWAYNFACFAAGLGFAIPEKTRKVREGVGALDQGSEDGNNLGFVSEDKARAAVRHSGQPHPQEERALRHYLFMNKLRAPCQRVGDYITPLFVMRFFVVRFFGLDEELVQEPNGH